MATNRWDRRHGDTDCEILQTRLHPIEIAFKCWHLLLAVRTRRRLRMGPFSTGEYCFRGFFMRSPGERC